MPTSNLTLPFRKNTGLAPAPAQNSVSSIDLPTGPTYYTIALAYKNNGVDATEAQYKSDIKFVRLKINGITRQEYTADFIAHLALVNFQLGTGWTSKFYNTWNYLKAGQWQKAISNLSQSAWADQTPDRVAAFTSAIRRNFA